MDLRKQKKKKSREQKLIQDKLYKEQHKGIKSTDRKRGMYGLYVMAGLFILAAGYIFYNMN